MSNKDEALKLAEDVLKRVRTQDMELVQLSMIALAAIKEALAEQPAQQEPVAWMHEWEDGERIPMLTGRDDRNNDRPKSVRPLVYGDTPQAQPAQLEAKASEAKEQPAPGRAHYEDGDVFERIAAMKKQPAQRTWVSLTDEQWQSIADTLGCIITRSQKDAIEATIGIKGAA